MEPEEENLYVNLEDLDGSKQQRPEHAECEPGGKPEETASEGGTRTGTRTGSCFKVATLFLGLLSFLLLTSVVAVGFLYQRDFSQLSRELANQTAERSQVLLMQQNLTNQRDRLDARLKAAELDLDRTRSGSVFCPAGWRRFGCSCYLLSSSLSGWESSRAQCLLTGSDLVIINSQEEMEFLDQLGAQLKFWIGLKEASRGSGWKWTDGSSPGVTFWTRQTSWRRPIRTQSCAAFNSVSVRGGRSWSEEWCPQLLQWVCEKKASASGRLQ
ncbi:CD209 antigen-like protein E isoform X1 [Xiphophorus maculatus]|uniref:CD209 antigen-like protein E isoform X1 n=1 Tax=Xiphophorus maculatus TaxID=8083 RepID=UPI000C6D8F84|nr:CD209 antigen-like protein E isoform X1 [Xiphophorus maculatus]